VTHRARPLQTLIGLLLLPVSLLPFWAYFRYTAEGRVLWTRATIDLSPPHLPLVRVAATPLQPYTGGVAVLVYHGLGSTLAAEGRFTISISKFAEQIATLRAAGMEFVTARDLVELRRRGVAPPPNAVMITFDDGRSEAMMLADPILAQARARATMFVITDAAADPGIFYASEDDLRGYAASGRWDLEGHTAGLHDLQDTRAGSLPKLTSLADDESLAEFERRVNSDLDRADRFLRDITGQPPVAFAYPFGAYGADRSNDPRIGVVLPAILARHYALGFQQDDQATVPLVGCADPALRLRRLEVESWTGTQLLARIEAMRARTWPTTRCPAPAP